MSFVDPVTIADPITGTKATAALLNTWRADMEYLHGPVAGCRLRTNTATNLGAAGQVPWELEDFDNLGCHSTSSNTSRITVPSNYGGMWDFGFTARTGSSSASTTVWIVGLNGTFTGASILATGTTVTAASTTSTASGSGRARLAVGDYIELRGGGTLSVTFNPCFWAQWREA